MDDESLVRTAVLGRKESLVELYRRYVGQIYRFFYWQTNRSKEVAEDLTSQTFLELVRSLGSFAGRGSFKAYLYGIARRVLMDYVRSKYKEPMVPLFESLSIGEEVLDEEAMKKKIERVEGLLARLAPRENEAVRQRYLHGATSEEIALKLGVSVSNAKVILHRAMRKLARGVT